MPRKAIFFYKNALLVHFQAIVNRFLITTYLLPPSYKKPSKDTKEISFGRCNNTYFMTAMLFSFIFSFM